LHHKERRNCKNCARTCEVDVLQHQQQRCNANSYYQKKNSHTLYSVPTSYCLKRVTARKICIAESIEKKCLVVGNCPDRSGVIKFFFGASAICTASKKKPRTKIIPSSVGTISLNLSVTLSNANNR
jgi:hypothetical protein